MIYIAKPSGDVLGALNGLKEETCNLKRSIIDMWELSFEVTKYIDDNNNFESSDYYDSIAEKMRIRLETDLIDTMFVIDSEPVVSNNGIQEIKTVTAHTIECELQHKFLRLFYINNGNPTSKEYLAKNNINSYTQLPNEYISLVNFDNHELSLLHLALENTEWTIDENLKKTESEMCAKKFAFSIDEKDIYSFLMEDVAKTAQIIFLFDRKTHIISFKSFENLGEDTGIFIGLRNLANQIDIESTSEYGLITKYKPICSESLGIEYVNFGDPYMYNMDYFANTHNEYGDFKYVTESFHDEYTQWMKDREEKRQEFINITKDYNQNLIKIDELKNRLPNDGCNIDYKTYKADELYLSLNAYENAVATLLTLYKEDYKNIYTNPTVALNEDHLKTTMYWNDYYSYRYQIIPSVLEAMKIWYKTDSNGCLLVGDDGKYIVCENGNPAYANNVDIVKPIDSFKYEFELYGLDELNSKKKAWMECVNLLYKDGFIKSGTIDNPIEYVTPDEDGWNYLTPQQKLQFTTFTTFKEHLNNYLDYMSINVRENSITGTSCKGIIRQCEDAIAQRQSEINTLQTNNDAIQKNRDALSSSVLPENNFSSENLKIFRLLTHEDNYTNENIVTTSLDDIVSIIDVAEELYQDAKEKLSVVSQPQYSFKTTMDNLFALEEFSLYAHKFEIGNFIKLLPDLFSDNFVKLRIISIEINPIVETMDFAVEFSTMTRSLSDINDMAFLFDNSNSSDASAGNSGSGSSGGTYGKNDAEIQIANNMLNALLKTETFGTQVSDIILDSIKTNRANFGKLIAHSGVFDSLESGQIKISGECLFDIIKSSNYIEGESGSILDLFNGGFDFAGGRLTWDGKKFNIIVDSFSLSSGDTIESIAEDKANDALDSAKLYADHVAQSAVNNQTQEYIFNKLTNNGTIKGIYMQNGELYINASYLKSGTISADLIKGGKLTLGGMNNQNGYLEMLDADGNAIGGWTEDKFFIGDYFVIDKDGTMSRDKSFHYKYSTYMSFNVINPSHISSMVLTLCNVEGDQLLIQLQSYSTENILYYLYLDESSVTVKTKNVVGELVVAYGISVSYNKNSNEIYISIPSLAFGNVNPYRIFMIVGDYDNQTYGYAEIKEMYTWDSSDENKTIYQGEVKSVIGLMVDTTNNQILGGNFELNSNNLLGYNDFSFRLKNNLDDENSLFYINKNYIYHSGLMSSSSGNTLVSVSGAFHVRSSSSKRYKENIVPIEETKNLSPEKLYNINVMSYRYKKDYLPETDQRFMKLIPGFIAEDVYEKYPIACDLNENGEPEMWDINIMFPAALKLIQEQHEEIEKLKRRIEVLEQKI